MFYLFCKDLRNIERSAAKPYMTFHEKNVWSDFFDAPNENL